MGFEFAETMAGTMELDREPRVRRRRRVLVGLRLRGQPTALLEDLRVREMRGAVVRTIVDGVDVYERSQR